jgi:hypothetical protein
VRAGEPLADEDDVGVEDDDSEHPTARDATMARPTK